jgi:ribose 5-phosphate isomerase B
MARLAITADHNGVALKERLLHHLTTAGHLVEDLGVGADDGEVDYPALCVRVCGRVLSGDATYGIVVGGSGQGESITCNRHRGIRAGVAWSPWAAEISRGNNDANVLIIPAKALGADEAVELVDLWLRTPFKGGVHARRIAQIDG